MFASFTRLIRRITLVNAFIFHQNKLIVQTLFNLRASAWLRISFKSAPTFTFWTTYFLSNAETIIRSIFTNALGSTANWALAVSTVERFSIGIAFTHMAQSLSSVFTNAGRITWLFLALFDWALTRRSTFGEWGCFFFRLLCLTYACGVHGHFSTIFWTAEAGFESYHFFFFFFFFIIFLVFFFISFFKLLSENIFYCFIRSVFITDATGGRTVRTFTLFFSTAFGNEWRSRTWV